MGKGPAEQQNKPKKGTLVLLSFFIPFLVIMVAMFSLRVTPFGNKSLIISDANAYYINTLGYAGRMFRGLEGLTYSLEKGLGGNMMGHLNGILLTPFGFLFSLVSIQSYPLAFTFISALNFSACGLTMYLLLADLYGHKASNLIFSTAYALMGFNVANAFQAVFFCAAAPLPVMALGLRRLFRGKSPLLYMLTIAYGLLTNAYFGFVLCVASLLFFLTGLALYRQSVRPWRLFLRYAVSSLCAGLLAAALWLPGFLSLRGGRLDQTGITDFTFGENMPFIEIFSKLFTGANTTSQLVNGLPNLFVGLLPVALVILFFMNRKIGRRTKTAAGALLVVYLLVFYIVALDMLMHGGTKPNWFNHRYSYVFSFLLLMAAAYEWQYVDDLAFRDLRNCFVGMIVGTLIVFSKRYEYVMGGEVLLDFALLVLIFLAYRLYRLKPQFNPKRTFEAVTIVIVSIALFLNYVICTKNIMVWGHDESGYQATVNAVSPLVDGVKAADQSLFRMEVNRQRSGTTGNDPMLYGYYGVGHGGSYERNFVREELNKLGVQWFDMRNYYAQGIPAATDALLGIKYMVADEDLTGEKGYIRMTNMRDMGLAGEGECYDLYRDPYALPVAFLSEQAVNGLELDYDDLFDNLNRVWSAISGSDKPAFAEEEDIAFRTLNLADSQQMTAGEARGIVESYAKKPEGDASSDSGSSSASEDDALTNSIVQDDPPMFASCVEFSFTARQDGPVYVYHRAALSNINGCAEPVVHYMGEYHIGDTVSGYLTVQADYVNKVTFEEFAGRFRAAYADLDALQSMSEAVAARPSTIERIRDSHLKGTMTVQEGQELLFTIPWDEGWTCWVDGEKTELTKVLGVFMAVQAAPGEHTWEMRYTPTGLKAGIIISAGALVFLLLYLILIRKRLSAVLVHGSAIGTAAGVEEAAENPGPGHAVPNEVIDHDSV